MAANELAPIIIKKVVKGGHSHHGGAWKVAYADFVTAMMAFFLLLWLLNATTEDQKQGISEYFSPSTVSKTTGGAGGLLGGAVVSSPGAMTSRTAVPSVSLELRPTSGAQAGEETEEGGGKVENADPENTGNITDEKMEAELAKREQAQFAQIEAELKQAIAETPDLKELQKHLVIDSTPEGMRIQIVDQHGEPMFPNGSARMPEKTRKLLQTISGVVKKMPNMVSIAGHTDAVTFRGSRQGFGNWELSANRALASRRVLVESGLPMERVAQVSGKAATEPLVKDDPKDPRNRRISIILLREAGKKAKGAAGVAKPVQPKDASGEPIFKRDWSGPRLK